MKRGDDGSVDQGRLKRILSRHSIPSHRVDKIGSKRRTNLDPRLKPWRRRERRTDEGWDRAKERRPPAVEDGFVKVLATQERGVQLADKIASALR
jgi:hypothetical protein